MRARTVKALRSEGKPQCRNAPSRTGSANGDSNRVLSLAASNGRRHMKPRRRLLATSQRIRWRLTVCPTATVPNRGPRSPGGVKAYPPQGSQRVVVGAPKINVYKPVSRCKIYSPHNHPVTRMKRPITIVEARESRATRLALLLKQLHPGALAGPAALTPRASGNLPERMRSVGYDSQSKPHIFVAMPFAEEMEDVFHFGIQGPVNASGFLCERADIASFTGDVVEWVKRRIASASLVIADLSGANPNVYLEVGYAWGCGRPTILLTRDTSHLRFDVQSQKCLTYKKIKDLESMLQAELKNVAKHI